MRTVHVTAPSFPHASANRPLAIEEGRLWQVLCGDGGHWRTGMYAPALTSAEACTEFERHSCPELFALLSGRISLVLLDGAARKVIELEVGRPVLVTAPHAGFCPDGPHAGRALVVERDSFSTAYGASTAEIEAAIAADQNWK